MPHPSNRAFALWRPLEAVLEAHHTHYCLEQSIRSLATSGSGAGGPSHPLLWCDRDTNEPPPTDALTWPDKEDVEDEQGCQLHKVSARTEALLKDTFGRSVQNSVRRRWKKTYGMPACEQTRCPKLDNVLKSQVPKTCKDADRPWSRAQALVLDAVGPLTYALEQHQAGKLGAESAAEAITQALKFWETLAQTSQLSDGNRSQVS